MKSFSNLRVTRSNLEAIALEIEQYKQTGNADRIIAILEQSRAKTIREHNAMLRELKAIKADNEEVYRLIYWHDLQGKPWRECFRRVYPDLYSSDPASSAFQIVRRYLLRYEYALQGFCEASDSEQQEGNE